LTAERLNLNTIVEVKRPAAHLRYWHFCDMMRDAKEGLSVRERTSLRWFGKARL
jgi:hypothetical protein